ncbi:MAG: 50S ribosomal protein L21 [Chthoniobacterales bacterium]
MAYAIFQTGGKQYRVEKGDILDVEKLEIEAGQKATFDEVLLVSDGKTVSVGTPHVSGAKVTAEVVDQVKDDKVVAYKFKRRKGYHRTVGHRQRHTRLKITGVAA